MNKKKDKLLKDVISLVKKYIKGKNITQNQNLIDSGLLDSLALAELIFEIEEKYKFKMSTKEFNALNFKTINNIFKFINKKI